MQRMTMKEAVLQSLNDLGKITNHQEVYEHILQNNYYDFGESKTPKSTVSAALGDFIRNGDSRVRRIPQPGGTFSYYLTKLEDQLDVDLIKADVEKSDKTKTITRYKERSLHILLSSFLRNTKTFSKTIYHEESKNGKDKNQVWTHPDMVGIRFLHLSKKQSQALLKSVNSQETFKISSYELKREINSDSELKKAFFQAVSNSSWANYGYLVAFDFSENLHEEMERLSQAFGIGIIKLNANPFKSKVLYPPKFRDLDFKTIDKLCVMNDKFAQFIEQIDNLMNADDRYLSASQKQFEEFCDSILETDEQISAYCKKNHIPIEQSTTELD
jgi:hypothetical protein